MAFRNELGSEKSLFWITELPYEGKQRRSSNFSLMGSEWYLQFTYKDASGYFHALTLHRATIGGSPQQIEFKVRTHVMNPNVLDYSEKGVRNATVQQAETSLWGYGGTRDYIFQLLPSLYESGVIKFVCKFYGKPESAFQLEIAKEPARTDEKSIQVSSEIPRDIESLSSDFSRLFGKEILPDMRLECGGRTFQAHRSVLVARSRVFKAMFENKTLENETGAVKIPDVDEAVLEKLLKFVYTGKPEDICESNAADLYEAADKYAVLSLTSACAYWIQRNLTVENCVNYLKVSDSHYDRDLKASVVSFITDNPGVMKSEAWFALSKELPSLAIEVLQTYVSSIVP